MKWLVLIVVVLCLGLLCYWYYRPTFEWVR